VNALLDDLCDAFIPLKNGVVLDIAGYGKNKYTGSLSFVLADTLAAHFLGWIQRKCRTCTQAVPNMGS